MLQFISDLETAQVGEIRLNEPLASYTTWKIGGPDDIFIIPATKEKLVICIQLVNRYNLPWHVIGRGSNLLVGDQGFRGVVL
jgi:UDP-N-acetylmuramate dehydrogenase